MKITLIDSPLGKIRTDLLAIALYGDQFSPLGTFIDRMLDGWLSKLIKQQQFKGKVGDVKLLPTLGKFSFANLLIVGMGEAKSCTLESFRKGAAAAIKTAEKIRAEKLTLEFHLPAGGTLDPLQAAQSASEGLWLGSYRFDRYKKSDKPKVAQVDFLIAGKEKNPAIRQGIHRGTILADATCWARDMINTPACDMTPKRMAEEAKKLRGLPGIKLKILEKSELARLGMRSFLAVSQGSDQPPCLIHLHYRPTGKIKRRVAIVGKGVTFDSGGLSLKTPSTYMETMKDDMSGGAAVLGICKALAALKLPVEVHGIVAATENMPSGSADKPGDVVRAMMGKTIEILNTDAEGRLTLADALPYAIRQKPDLVIDMATLTGACVVALGELCAGIMGNDQGLIDNLIAAGKVAGERIWQLPLIEEYKEDIKSTIADVKNTGGRYAGTITAGLFLQEFVEPTIPWAHVDIAGPAWSEKDTAYTPRGGAGFMVRTIIRFLEQS